MQRAPEGRAETVLHTDAGTSPLLSADVLIFAVSIPVSPPHAFPLCTCDKMKPVHATLFLRAHLSAEELQGLMLIQDNEVFARICIREQTNKQDTELKFSEER